MVSVIIPARNEIFLQQTIDNLLENATGEIEIIAGLDGYWPNPPIRDDKRVHLLHFSTVQGMRNNINAMVRISKGEYIMKCDAHCAFAPGFDEVLVRDCVERNWIMIPRRYSLDVEGWGIEDNGKVRDSHYLSYPTAFPDNTYLGFGMHVKDWYGRGMERAEHMIDEDMTFQGSCWFMHKEYYTPMNEVGYGPFIQEAQELGLKIQLSGGKIMTNKNTWYAHLWKGKRFGRMYDLSRQESKIGEIYSADFWYNNRWDKRIHDFEWLIDKFWPIPTWPENWKDLVIDFPKVIVQVPEVNAKSDDAESPRTEKVMNRRSSESHIEEVWDQQD